MKLLSLILNWEKLVSLIKLLEHVKFGEATTTSHSVVKEQLIISDTYYRILIKLSHFPNLQKMTSKQEMELEEITKASASSSNVRSEPLEHKR